MRILFLSPNLSDYRSAFYQQDFLAELQAQHEVTTYGPGITGYSPKDTIEDVLRKTNASPDLICLGHNWLITTAGEPVRRNEDLDLEAVDVPTVLMLNKVYSRFEQKVNFAEDSEIDLVFTHHHHALRWSEEYKTEFIFLPFAVDTDAFKDYGEPKRYDFTFSGILQNPNPDVPQTDIRKRIQDRMFHTIDDIWILPKYRYRNLDPFWNIRPTSKPGHALFKLLGRNRHLPEEQYKRLLNRSKIVLNSLSPMELVGTRYYETMASNALAFCQESPIYTEYGLFEPGEHCVTFAEDLSDFDEKLFYYLEQDGERERIAKQGHQHVIEHHGWANRVESFVEIVDHRLL